MRGIRLDELVDRLRAEVGHSTNAQVGQNSADYLIQVLSRTQRRLVEEYDWQHLKVHRDIPVVAGQRYYPCPSDLHYERIIDIDFKDGTLWRPLVKGIKPELYNVHDSDKGHHNWPLYNWDVHENFDGPTDTVGFIEFWPIPNRSATQFDGMVRLTGFMQAPELINGNDKCVLDGSLLVLYAAAEICARQNQSDAQLKLTAAQQLMSRLQNQNSNKKKYVSFSPNAAPHSLNPYRPRNIVGVSRSGSGSGSGGISDAPADGNCYVRKDYNWVEISACISCDGDGGSGVIDGTIDNVTLRWDADTGEWIENSALRSNGVDSISIYDQPRTNAWNLRALRMENAYDPWLDETKDFNFLVVEPRGPFTSNSNEKFGVSVLADRFTVRSGDESGNPTQQAPAFRVDNEQIDIGLRDYTTNTFINGDAFIGMSSNMYGVDLPFNSDSAPGTLFAGGIAMAGSYINGQSLDPIGNEGGEGVLDRAFAKDAQLNINGNRLYGLPAPTRPDDAVNLAYFEANAGGGGNGPADNVANGTETGQLLGWNGADKYTPVSFAKFLSGPDRLETQTLYVNGAPTVPQAAVNKGHLEKYVDAGAVEGGMLIWDNTEKVYKAEDRLQYRNERLDIASGITLRKTRTDNIGYQFIQEQYASTLDPWTGEYINLNSLQIQPYADTAGSGYESGIAMLGDRFTVRVPATGDDPYNGEIAFRVRKLEAVIGVDNKETSVILQGDTYVGYERTNRPDNNDEELGTFFVGRGIIVGKGNPAGEASINMNNNIIFGLADPANDTCAVSKGWVKRNALFTDSGTDNLTVKGSLLVNGKSVFKDDVSIQANATIGLNDFSTIKFLGDAYIGHSGVLPNNDDDEAGTLFLGRGAIIGRGAPAGTASIGMEGNVIWELGDPQAAHHATNKRYVDAAIAGIELPDVSIPQNLSVSTISAPAGATLGGTTINGNATIGASNYSTIHTKGDVYVGYEGALPNNNDTVGGTLFCARGILIGRDLPAGSASIGMNDNFITNVRYPQYADHAPNVQWCADVFVQKNRSNDLAAAAIAGIEKATDLDSVKAAMIEMLKEQMKDDKAMPTGIAG